MRSAVSKALLVLISVLILPISLVWGALYLALGSPVGCLALLYSLISVGSDRSSSRGRATSSFLLRVELIDILLAPTISMASLGGFLASGGVGLWGILAPLGALVFGGCAPAVRWYVAFLVVFLASGIAGEILGAVSDLPTWFTSTMLALNITVGGTIVFTLLAIFAKQRQDALGALRIEQAKAENLLLNILPRSIADKLKAGPRRSPTSSASASILFADVVDFTPQVGAPARPPRSSACSTTSSATSTRSSSGTGWRRSRRSATATWSPPAFRRRGPITPGRWP